MDSGVSFLSALFEELTVDSQCEKERISKSEKRIQRFEALKECRRRKRVDEHRRRRERQKEAARKEDETKSAKEGVQMRDLSICIDLGFSSAMNAKERGKLIRQLGRVWGLQKRYSGLHTTLVNMDDSFQEESRRIVTGFEKFEWNVTSDSLEDFHTASTIVYLSPDAHLEPLLTIKADSAYVIGGLVDESGKGSMSREKAEALEVKCRRLPIPEFMEKESGGTYNVMLTINQVVEILCRFAVFGDWAEALGPVVPARTGYVVRND